MAKGGAKASGTRPATANPSGRGAQTRAALVAAASQALREVGFAAASAREIARRAGCQQGQVFYHFGSVNGLLLAALDAVSQRRFAAYEQLLDSATDAADLFDAAAEVVRTDLESGDVSVLVELIAGARLVPGLSADVAARLVPWQEFAHRAVAKALPDNPIAALVPTAEVAHAVVAGILGLELLALADGDRATPERVLDKAAGALALLDLLTRSALPTEPPP